MREVSNVVYLQNRRVKPIESWRASMGDKMEKALNEAFSPFLRYFPERARAWLENVRQTIENGNVKR